MVKGYIFMDLDSLRCVNEPELLSNLIADGWVIKAVSTSNSMLDNFLRIHNMPESSRIHCGSSEKNSSMLLLASLVGGVFAHNDSRKIVLLSFNNNAKKIANLMSGLGHNCVAPINVSKILNYSNDSKAKILRDELRVISNCIQNIFSEAV